MKNQQSITSLPESPEVDRRRRMINYSVAMSIRMIFVILCFFVQGWWLLFTAIGAILLPYVAVVLANNVVPRGGASATLPGTLALDVGREFRDSASSEDAAR
ncbi:MAG: DUF3099 domain-containing protein [Microbacteriaceae bacterium]